MSAKKTAQQIAVALDVGPQCKHDTNLIAVCQPCLIEQVSAAIEQAEARGRRSEAKLNPAYLRAFAEGRDAGLEEAAEVVQNRPNLLLRTTREEANKKCGGGVMREVAEEIRALKRGGRER